MADRGIIFSAPMVRALIEGRKTQTRRILKPQPPADARYSGVHFSSDEPDSWFFNSPRGPMKVRERYAPGDRLYVREAVCWVSAWGWRYRADNEDLSDKREDGEVGRWRPSIHMPRWASRITLTVTEVRVQRLQEISEADAVAEGVDAVTMDDVPRQAAMSRRSDFSALWNSLHGPDAWATNPWVAAYSFTVRQGNIDA